MRDKRFIAVHRGGPLRRDQHYQLMEWACNCAEHVLHLYEGIGDVRLRAALSAARDWKKGVSSVGDARNASLDVIALARDISNPISIAITRSVGHAVATVHMADHSLEAALYALKAVHYAGKSIEEEKKWQTAVT